MKRTFLYVLILIFAAFAVYSGPIEEIPWFFPRVSLSNNGDVRLFEAAANGTSYVSLIAPASLSANPQYIFPGTAATGALVFTNAAGVMTGAIQAISDMTTGTFTTWLRGGDGSAAAPAYSYTGDTNTGQYRIGADNIGWSTGGTLRMDLASSLFTSTVAITSTGATDITAGDDLISTDDVTVGDDITVAGLATVGETLGVTGLTTVTGGITSGLNAVTGADSLVAADCGRITTVTAGIDTFELTLPEASTVIGCTFNIVFIGASASALLDITPLDSDADGIVGSCTLAASVVTFSGTADANVKLTKATGLIGDYIKLTAVSASQYAVTGCQGIWAN